MIKRDKRDFLQTDVHRKDTAALLHATSAHPDSTINAIPTGQFLLMRRICSQDTDFEKLAEKLEQWFMERGYSKRSIKRACKRAKNPHIMTLCALIKSPSVMIR